jgi:transcriptional regulator with XRE-family HTH domain
VEADFGKELKRWRSARRLSQLDLAAAAGVSQRHISFLETGRSHPSREMVLHLAVVMEMPLRSRNQFLGVAGFTPAYRERTLGDEDMQGIAQVLGRLLEAHQPFPAYVVDRLWNIQLSNSAAMALVGAVAPAGFNPDLMAGNAMRLLLHPQGLSDVVVNRDTVAAVLVDRIRREVEETPDDQDLADILAECLDHVGATSVEVRTPAADDLLVPIVLRTEEGIVRFFTTIATIGAPYDVTLEELRIETLLPADDESEGFLRKLAGI